MINQFAEGLGKPLQTFLDVLPHLNGLFRYGLGNFRLNAVSSASSRSSSFYRGVYIDPMWQLLLQDVEFYAPDPGLSYKRVSKKPGQGGLKNIHLAVGNLLSVYARKRFTPWQAVKALQHSGIWEEYAAYFRSKFDQVLTDNVLVQKVAEVVAEGLQVRTLAGAAA